MTSGSGFRGSVFIGTSLDGFIARPDGGIDWLPTGGEEDYGYGEFFASVDALVMGRNTYELVRSFGEWPYGDKPVIVLTGRSLEIPSELSSTVRVRSGDPVDLGDELASEGIHHAYVDGGVTIQRFLRAGLIERMTITRIPVLIGQGIPRFGPLEKDIRLEHLETRSYPNGLVQSTYRVAYG